MFIIETRDYKNATDKNKPLVLYDSTFYESYEKAKDAVKTTAISFSDYYNTDPNKDYFTFDLIPSKSYDCRILNAYGEIDYEFAIMEFVRKLPE